MAKIKAEYIWIDGKKPTPKLRSKTGIINGPISERAQVPDYGFDGSSTFQADGPESVLALHPVTCVPDPIRGGDHVLVMNEVCYPDGAAHETNKRAHLVKVAGEYEARDAWIGIEQEYTFFRGRSPLGWPEGGYPAPHRTAWQGVSRRPAAIGQHEPL